MKTKMQMNQWVAAAAIFSVYGAVGQLIADETADTVKDLKQQNELLNQRVKALEEQLNQKIKALEDLLNQKVKVVDQKRQLDRESTDAKLKEATSKLETTSKFKMPDWLTGVRLINDIRMRYDEVFAPDPDFVTRWRERPRLRLGGIASLKDDWEIGFRLASTPSVGNNSGGDPLSTNQTFEDNGSRKPVVGQAGESAKLYGRHF